MVGTTIRLDPTQSFIDYVNTVKPYHTKILEVGVEYLWNDDVNVTVLDSSVLDLELLTDDAPTAYLHGWGSTWDPPTQFQTTVFRIADFVAGSSGSITIEGDHVADVVIGSRFVTWYDTDTLPSSVVYTVTSVTLVSGNTRLGVAEIVVGPGLAPWYGLVALAIPLVKYDKTTNSIIVTSDISNLAVDGTVIFTPTLAFPVVGVLSGNSVDRCYFDISDDHISLFPDGTRFTLSGGSNAGQYNVAPGGAIFDSGSNTTRVFVQQAVANNSVSGQILTAGMHIVQHATPDFQILAVGMDYFVVRGDRTADFPNGGPAYQLISPQGDASTYATTIADSQVYIGNPADYMSTNPADYVGDDPNVYFVDPVFRYWYFQLGMSNVTIIKCNAAPVPEIYIGGRIQLAQDQTQIFVKSEVDILPQASSSRFVFCFPNGEGWSSPEYSALLSASQLHTDGYVHERFSAIIYDLVRAASTSDVSATYSEITPGSGVGATLTSLSNQPLPLQDGVQLDVGDMVLIKDQTTTAENGVYVVTDLGSNVSPWIMTRYVMLDTSAELFSIHFYVTSGNTFQETFWRASTPNYTFVQYDGSFL